MTASVISEKELSSAFQDSNELRQVLTSLTFDRPRDMAGWEEDVAAHESLSEGNEKDYPELRIYAEKAGSFGLKRLIATVSKVLAGARHLSPRASAALLLAAFVFHRDRKREPVLALRRLLSSTTQCGLMQYFIPLMPSPSAERKLGPFTIGAVPHDQIRYWSERVGSDYYARHGERLHGRLCIARDPASVPVVPLNRADHLNLVARSEAERALGFSITDRYFGELGRARLDEFWAEFRSVQLLSVALGEPYLDPKLFRSLGVGAAGISIFTKLGGLGWVAPVGQGWTINMSPTGLARAGTLPPGVDPAKIRPEFKERLEAFGHMIARAAEHEMNDRRDEAFLHRVIGIDAVLGEVEGTTEAVATRGALLLPAKFGKTLDERRGLLKAIYNARSRYVHEGRSCDASYFDRLELICPVIAFALVRVGQRPSSATPSTIAQWHQMLDAAYGAQGSGLNLGLTELEKIGLSPAPGDAEVAEPS